MTTNLEEKQTGLKLKSMDLRPLGANGCLWYAPSGQAYEIDAAPKDVMSFLGEVDGVRTRNALLAKAPDRNEYDGFLTLLAEEGCLYGPEVAPAAIDRTSLFLLGDTELCEICASMAGGWREVRRLSEDSLASSLAAIEAGFSGLVLAVKPYLDSDWFLEIERQCRKTNQAWMPLHFDQGKAFIGPAILPGKTSDFEDWFGRRLCSGDHVEGAQLSRPLLPEEGAPCPLPQPQGLGKTWIIARFMAEAERLAKRDPGTLFSTELEMDATAFATRLHTVLPLPTRVPESWLGTPRPPKAMLVDHRTGIVLSQQPVAHHDTLPKSLITVRTHCTDLSRLYPWGNDLFVGGSAFNRRDIAEGASLGEALERYCGNCLPGVQTVRASFRELQAQGRRALDPTSLVLHSADMLAAPGCPFVPFTKDLTVQWVAGHSVTRDEPCLLPLSLVYANWCSGPFRDEPVTNYLYTPGMAAGETLERALVGAIRELVERDITMAWWLNAHPLPAVAPTPALEALWDGVAEREHQKVRFVHLDNDFQIPVMVAIVQHTGLQLVNIGFGCRPDPEAAARKALTEALTLQEGSRDLLSRESMLRKSASEWGLLDVDYKPWREDRTYVDAYRSDYRDVDDLMLQQQFYLDPRAIEPVRHLMEPPISRQFSELPRLPDDAFETYRAMVEAEGFEVLFADITSPDVALTGFKVVRAIVPGLIPNMPAAFPAVGGPRVFSLPVKLGWRDTPLRERDLNFHPMPHA